MATLIVILFSCYISGALSGMLGPCKKQDRECIQKSIDEVFPKVFAGIPSKKVDSSDPLFVDFIDGNLSVLKYNFINTTVVGFKDCAVKNSKLDVDALKLYFEMHCGALNMEGDYKISGKLISLPVEGMGSYKLISSKYSVSINSGLKKIKGDDGKTYVNIKSFEVKPKVLGPVEFKFDNLFNGQKDLSDAVHKFASEFYVEVAELVQDPIFNVNVKALSKNINKFLMTEPVEEIFID